jgi:ABC-type glycerol-3-phosphate transport system substrate-binding protein
MFRALTRRELLRWGALGAGAVALAACAPKEQAPAPKEEAPEAQPAAEEAKPAAEGAIVLRFMTRQGDAGIHMREFGNRYAEESEGRIKVEFEEAPWDETPKILETQLVSGTMVDATWGDTAWWPNMARRGAYLVIEEYVAEAGMNLDDWYNVEWFRKWTDGQLSGLGGAAGFHPGITFYNREWVLEAWGKEPTDDWTFEDYTECIIACAKLKGDGYFGGNADIGGGHRYAAWTAGSAPSTAACSARMAPSPSLPSPRPRKASSGSSICWPRRPCPPVRTSSTTS